MMTGLDPGLEREAFAIRAIDQHAHPVPVGGEPKGDPDRPLQPYGVTLPLRMRLDNPEYLDAWAALWGYTEPDWSLSRLRELMARKEALIEGKGVGYNAWILDKLNIETMIAIAPGPSASEAAPHFRWCAFSDWFLWPFPMSEVNPSGMARMYRATNDRFCKGAASGERPPSLDRYVEEVMLPTLALYKEQGAVGLKFHGPYNRSLAFDLVEEPEARRLYLNGIRDGALRGSDHKALQDFLFERLVREAGRIGFVVQMHTGLGLKQGFVIAGSNPLLMERLIRAVPGTRFVLLHGGWPFVIETVALLTNKNVYTDFSCANLYQYPRSLSRQIRAALEWHPEKLLYGTDAYSDRSIGMLGGMEPLANPLAGWEEKAWLMDRAGRTALALALSGMREDGELTSGQAEARLAQVMRTTAIDLYRLET